VDNDSQKLPWTLIAIAALGLVLGVVAMLVAFDAKDKSEEGVEEVTVVRVQSELSNLVDRLGIAEKSLRGDAQVANGQAQRATRESRNAAINLSNRIDRLERQVPKLNKNIRQTATLTKQVAALGKGVSTVAEQVKELKQEVATLNQRVTGLAKRFNQVSASASNSGGKSAP
jgi:outer membrane murein-binding lipoprotein Lpp